MRACGPAGLMCVGPFRVCPVPCLSLLANALSAPLLAISSPARAQAPLLGAGDPPARVWVGGARGVEPHCTATEPERVWRLSADACGCRVRVVWCAACERSAFGCRRCKGGAPTEQGIVCSCSSACILSVSVQILRRASWPLRDHPLAASRDLQPHSSATSKGGRASAQGRKGGGLGWWVAG